MNAAGLSGDAVAGLVGIDVVERGYRLHLCKGDYFSLAPGAPIRLNHLVYPVHTRSGLGVHATLDLGGRIRFGPDTAYVDTIDYDVDEVKAEGFAEAVRRYLPELRTEWLSPDYAGIRPKLAGPGETFRDFVITEQQSKLERVNTDLKDSVMKTRELRAELADRATESVHAEAKIREVETELSVAQVTLFS